MKILVIKLGALGDVVRTLSILPVLKKKYPDSEIYWVTKPNALQLFENNPYVFKAWAIPLKSSLNEEFDILYNFDVEQEASDIAKSTKAKEKLGFYSEDSFPQVFNLESEYYLNTIFDDYLKKTNKKTYQQMMFEAAKIEWKKQAYEIFLTDKEKEFAKSFLKKNELAGKKIIGIHMGAGPRWPSKAWHHDNLLEFIIGAKSAGYEMILFGGPEEVEKQRIFVSELNRLKINVFQNNPRNTIREFAALVSVCNAMVCSDSFALHISLALKKPTVGLFFCTSADEIEDYGLLKKIISDKLEDFFPEKMDQYDEALVKSISSESVLDKIKELVKDKKRVVNAIILDEKKEKVLLIRRMGGIHSDNWAFPGGAIEKGETEEQALKREIKEEVGLEATKISKKIAEYEYPSENNEPTSGVSFLVNVRDNEIKIDASEVSDFKWATAEDLEFLSCAPGIQEEALKALYS